MEEGQPHGRSITVLKRYPLVAYLAVSFVFIGLAQRGLETVWVLYTGYRFGWDETTNGLSLAMVGAMAILVQGVLVKPFIKRFGERRTIFIGLVAATLAFLGYGLAYEGWMMFVVIIFGGLGGISGPAIQGLIAGTVAAHDQGKIQGAITSLMSLTSILAPLIFAAGLFSYFTSPASTRPASRRALPGGLGSFSHFGVDSAATVQTDAGGMNGGLFLAYTGAIIRRFALGASMILLPPDRHGFSTKHPVFHQVGC